MDKLPEAIEIVVHVGRTVIAAVEAILSLFGKGADEAKKQLEKRIEQATAENESMKEQIAQTQAKLDAAQKEMAIQVSLREQLNDAVQAMTEQILQLREAMKRGIDAAFAPTEQEICLAKGRLGYRDGYFHIAIAGCSGTGKSSLINALRGLKKTDMGAAAVGHNETTVEITRYESPKLRDKVLWYDVPGAGTLNIPRWDYFKAQCLYMFDAIILVWDNRLLDTDVAILMHCQNLKIPCFVVRSKCDATLLNFKRDVLEDMEDDEIVAGSARFQAEFNSRYQRQVAHFRRVTQQTVDDACRKESLPSHRVYMISERCIYRLIKGAGVGSPAYDYTEILDEGDFLQAFSKLTGVMCN